MEFKINRGQGKCSITGRAFTEGERYVVALQPHPEAGEDEGAFRRLEICEEAWETQDPAGFTAWWPTEHSVKRKPPLYDPDALWEIFHKTRRKKGEENTLQQDENAIESGDVEEFSREDLDRFAFVAALGLMRMKKLKLERTRRRGKREYMVFHTRGRKRERQTFEVLNPELNEGGIEQVQERLADLL